MYDVCMYEVCMVMKMKMKMKMMMMMMMMDTCRSMLERMDEQTKDRM